MKPSALLLLLVPALALAAPRPRAAALLVALDAQAEGSVPQLEAHLTRALASFETLQTRTPESLHGPAVDAGAQAALQRAQQALTEARAAFAAGRRAAAEERVRESLEAVRAAVPAMKGCAPLCDATALLAALRLERGDREGARLALLDLMALDPTYLLDPRRFRTELLSLRAEVGTSHAAVLRGSATVTSRPAGARVFLDGEPLGDTPLSIPALAVGTHLLRLERPGFRTEGLLLQASADELPLAVTLTPLASSRATRAQLETVARELAKEAPSSAAAVALGKSLGLERALLGSVRSLPGGSGSVLALGLYELQGGRRLAVRRVRLQGDEFGQLQGEMERLVNALLAATGPEEGAARAAAAKSRDPLDGASGTEDWSREDRGGKSQQKAQRAQDPLDAVSGTEDW